MPVKHAFGALSCNLKLVAKLAVFIIIIGLIAMAILSNIIEPLIDEIFALIAGIDVKADDFIKHPIQETKKIIDFCVGHITSQEWQLLLVSAIVTYVLLRFFFTIPLLPVTKVLHEKMTTGYDIGLFNAFIATGFQNLLLSFILCITISIIDISLIIGFGALLYLCIAKSLFFLLPLLIIIALCLFSARICLFSQWMPHICSSNDKNIFHALKSALKPTLSKFRKNFLCILAVNTIFFIIVSATIIPTLGAVPLICIPIYMVTHSALTLTLDFSYHKQKYYVDNGITIYEPTKLF